MNRSHRHSLSEDRKPGTLTRGRPARLANPDPATQYTSVGYDWFLQPGPSPEHRPVIIGLGTNLEPRETALRRAATELKSLLDDPVFSDVYETRPMYDPAQPRFLNACAGGWTLLGPPELLGALKALEAAAAGAGDTR